MIKLAPVLLLLSSLVTTFAALDVVVKHKEYIATAECPGVTIQALSHERYIEIPYANASRYGEVLYNFTAPAAHCRPDQYFVNKTAYPNINEELKEMVSFLHRDNITKGLEIYNGTTGNALATRGDPGSIQLAKRFVFSWAAAKAFFSLLGYAGTLVTAVCQAHDYITGNSWSGRAACVAGTTLAAIGGSFTVMDNFKAAKGLFTTQTTTGYRSYAMETFGGAQAVDNAFGKRSAYPYFHPNNTGGILTVDSPRWNHTSTLRHPAGGNHTFGDLLSSRPSNPLPFLHTDRNGNENLHIVWLQSHPFKNHTATFHTTSLGNSSAIKSAASRFLLRRDQNFDVPGIDELMADYSSDEPTIYVGGDVYATNEVSALEWDMGTDNSENNGFAGMYDDITENMDYDQAWEACACYQENGQWTATTSIQYSWDNVYNGYSECWNANCDGA